MQRLALFNREISWIEFNSRVLHEALDPRTPLLERVRFLQIFTTNLDEFFMKRVGGLKRQQAVGILDGANQQPGPSELLLEIRRAILPQLERQSDAWLSTILPELRSQGIEVLQWSELHEEERAWLEHYFEENLFPVLTPLAVDPGHPFPFISNLSTSLGVLLRNPRSSHLSDASYETETLFARVKIPNSFPQWIRLTRPGSTTTEERFIAMTQVVCQFLGKLFPGMEILGCLPFRITRNADLERDEEDAEDLLEMITEELRERRFADVVRLELGPNPNPVLRNFLKNELDLSDEDIYVHASEVDFSDLGAICDLNRRDLKYRPWSPMVPELLADEETSMFSVIRDQDLMVHHPYESFHQSVERFVRTAVCDPKVLAIKMVLYRTGTDSPFIPLLIRAAEAGKQVVCLVELKARFDEERNIQVARSLEKAGVHVVYGIVGLKTHCKVTLVVRQEGNQVRSYAHIGTGNYHATTSRFYTDLGIFTARREFTDDVVQLFHYLTGRSLNREYKKLIIAPLQMKNRFLELIRFEASEAAAGRPARIIAKMNSLEDLEIIHALYEASAAGVQIDLIVRGFCCLVPGVEGLSQNIRVQSVIGRFLEHSRVFYFRHGADAEQNGLFLIGSADWMHRNLTARVETVAPIEDRVLKARLWDYLGVVLNDQRQSWDLQSDGTYVQRKPEAHDEGTHERMMRLHESTHVLRPAAVHQLYQ